MNLEVNTSQEGEGGEGPVGGISEVEPSRTGGMYKILYQNKGLVPIGLV